MSSRRQQDRRGRFLSAALLYGLLVLAPTSGLAWLGLTNIARMESDLRASQRQLARLSLEGLGRELATRIARRMDAEERRPYFEYQEVYRPLNQIGTNLAFVRNPALEQSDETILAWFQIHIDTGENSPQITPEALSILPRSDVAKDAVLGSWRAEIARKAAHPTTAWGPQSGRISRSYPLEVLGSNQNALALEPKIARARGGNLRDNEDLNWLANDWLSTQRRPGFRELRTEYTTFSRQIKERAGRTSLLALREVAVPALAGNRVVPPRAAVHLLQGFVLDIDALLGSILERVAPLLAERGIAIRSRPGPGEEAIHISLDEATGAQPASATENLLLSAHLDAARIEGEVAGRRADLGRILALLAAALALTSFFFFRSLARDRRLLARQRAFVAAVSHELRTPLAGIRLYTDLLGEGWVRSEQQRHEYLATLRGETRRLEKLVDDILYVAARERDEPRVRPEVRGGDLAQTVRSALNDFKASELSSGVAIDIAGCEQLGSVPHDAESIRLVLLNLFENAVKYASAERSARIELHCRRSDREACIEVADNGRGIRAEDRDHIFEDFFRTGAEERRRAPGAGLGLGVVRRHIEAHGGRIEVESAPGRGSRFTIHLPLQAQ